MKLKLLSMVLMFSGIAFSQTPILDSSMIAGNWILAKRTITKKGVNITDKLDKNIFDKYEFFKNGTYRKTYKDSKSKYISRGRWKVIEEGTKIHLFDNVDEPNDPKIEIADHDLPVVWLSGQSYLTYTCQDCLFAPSTDFYRKK
jgi:hypothetical protein